MIDDQNLKKKKFNESKAKNELLFSIFIFSPMSTNKVAQKKQYKKKLKEHEQEVTPVKIYLLIYNLVQTCGWYVTFFF